MNHITYSMPHPVLKPWGVDYPDSKFNVNVVGTIIGDNIRLDISYELTSSTLRSMLENSEAKLLIIAECSNTHSRVRHSITKEEMCVNLPRSDNARKIHLKSYIVTVDKSHLTCQDDHDPELKELIPDGVTLQPGAILAVGNPHEIMLSKIPNIKSAMSLKQDSNLEPGYYEIDLNTNSILIKLHPETYSNILKVRERNGDILYPSLFVTALVQAMREIEEHDERLWVDSLKKALNDKNIDYEDQDFKDHILKHAQTILDGPLNHLKIRENTADENE